MIKFYAGEFDLAEATISEQELEALYNQLEADKNVIKFNGFFFFTEESISQYPQIKKEMTQYNHFDNFIELHFEDEFYEDKFYLNGLLCVESVFVGEVANWHTEYNEEFHKSFMNNPEAAMNELMINVKADALSLVIKHKIEDIKLATTNKFKRFVIA